MTCIRCNVNPKGKGQNYCLECIREYQRERRRYIAQREGRTHKKYSPRYSIRLQTGL